MTVGRQLVHMPCFRLVVPEPAPLGPGRLVHLSWEEWQQLDDDFPYEQRKYDRVRPLFYEVAGAEEDLSAFKRGAAAEAYLALTIRNATVDRTPAPALAVGYQQSGPAVLQNLGPLEKVPLLWGLEWMYPTVELGADDIRRASSAFRLVRAAGAVDELSRLLSVLELTARPEIDSPTALVLCVAAIEDILVGEPVPELRKTFAARVAAIGAPEATAWQGLHDHAYLLYGLRSDIVHGDARPSRLEKYGIPSYGAIDSGLGRNLVRGILVRLTAAVAAGLSLENLGETLDAASADAAQLAALNRTVLDGQP